LTPRNDLSESPGPRTLLKPFPTENTAFTMAVIDVLDATNYLNKIVAEERMQLAFSPDEGKARAAYMFVANKMC